MTVHLSTIFATRIVELDRGVLRSYEGNCSRYLELGSSANRKLKKSKMLYLIKKLAEEEVWIRQGIKARTYP